jgi:non-specific serine/threonine protein kinase
MAGGLSNRGIPGRLVITEGTVEVHAKHILSKLGFRSRTQLAAWWARQHCKDTGGDLNEMLGRCHSGARG